MISSIYSLSESEMLRYTIAASEGRNICTMSGVGLTVSASLHRRNTCDSIGAGTLFRCLAKLDIFPAYRKMNTRSAHEIATALRDIDAHDYEIFGDYEHDSCSQISEAVGGLINHCAGLQLSDFMSEATMFLPDFCGLDHFFVNRGGFIT